MGGNDATKAPRERVCSAAPRPTSAVAQTSAHCLHSLCKQCPKLAVYTCKHHSKLVFAHTCESTVPKRLRTVCTLFAHCLRTPNSEFARFLTAFCTTGRDVRAETRLHQPRAQQHPQPPTLAAEGFSAHTMPLGLWPRSGRARLLKNGPGALMSGRQIRSAIAMATDKNRQIRSDSDRRIAKSEARARLSGAWSLVTTPTRSSPPGRPLRSLLPSPATHRPPGAR